MSDYLLSETHPIGRAKARYFNHLGFSRNNIEELKSLLLEIANNSPVEEQIDTVYGKKYVVKGDMQVASDKKYFIVTVWVIEKNDTVPRFVTAYPLTG
ncbi:MAG: hypothetical protein KGY38_07600 [Desulfobacterales bacterium]|nr:hypothetical protein [Desulfobacterales bacterium]